MKTIVIALLSFGAGSKLFAQIVGPSTSAGDIANWTATTMLGAALLALIWKGFPLLFQMHLANDKVREEVRHNDHVELMAMLRKMESTQRLMVGHCSEKNGAVPAGVSGEDGDERRAKRRVE